MESITRKHLDGNIWFTYFVKCNDGSLYAGVTTDIKKRLRQHNGEIVGGAKYTRAKRPVKMVYIEPHFSRSTSQSRESVIRKLSLKNKNILINEQNYLSIFKKDINDK